MLMLDCFVFEHLFTMRGVSGSCHVVFSASFGRVVSGSSGGLAARFWLRSFVFSDRELYGPKLALGSRLQAFIPIVFSH
jgi:hypothetical protein